MILQYIYIGTLQKKMCCKSYCKLNSLAPSGLHFSQNCRHIFLLVDGKDAEGVEKEIDDALTFDF